MHLVFISILPPDRHGVAEYGGHLVRALSTSVERITVLANTAKGGLAREEWPNGVQVRRCWTLGKTLSIVRLLFTVLRLRPDVVHINCGIRTWGNGRVDNFAGAWLCPMLRLFGLRVVTTVHTVGETVQLDLIKDEVGFFTRLGIDLAQRMYLASHVMTVPLRSMQASLVKRYRAKNVVHVPLGCYGTRGPGVTSGGFNVVTLGYWGAYKDPDVLVRAVRALRESGVPAMLTLAGGVHPYYPKTYGELVARYRDLDYVRFTGFVPDEDLDGVFGPATVVVLPYRTNAGASAVLNLARSYGKPVVISNEGALVEQHEDEGGAYEAFDSDASLVAALRKILSDEALQRTMGEANLAVAKAYSVEHLAPRFTRLYAHDALADATPAAAPK